MSRKLYQNNKSFLHYPLLWVPARAERSMKRPSTCTHTHFPFLLLPLTLTNITLHPINPILQPNWGISILFHILEQIPSLIIDAFQRRHHYIFRPLSLRNVLKTFMLVPKGSLLFFCYALISLFLLLPARESTLLFIFCLSDLCVDGINPVYPFFFTLYCRQTATVCTAIKTQKLLNKNVLQ